MFLEARMQFPDADTVFIGPCLYAVFLRPEFRITDIAVPEGGLLYIGKVEKQNKRLHFAAPHSGSSTLRRSLGALLKDQLDMQVHPRSLGRSNADFANYVFSKDAEKRLSNWMLAHLCYAVVPVEDEVRATEKQAIKELQPPLNLTDWRNPQRKHLKELRKRCADEARARAVQSPR